jgi:hypothetical protein
LRIKTRSQQTGTCAPVKITQDMECGEE